MHQTFRTIIATLVLAFLGACASGPYHQYRNVGKFNEGLAPVQASSGKWGFINLHHQWVIPPRFDDAHEFQNNQAAVKQNGKWGFINRQGQWQ